MLPDWRSPLGSLDTRRSAARQVINVRPSYGVSVHPATDRHGSWNHLGSEFMASLVTLDRVDSPLAFPQYLAA